MEIRFLVSIESYFNKFKSVVGPDTILYANPSLGAVFGCRSSVLTRLPGRHTRAMPKSIAVWCQVLSYEVDQ